jgi:zinc transport system substrate-binding protein
MVGAGLEPQLEDMTTPHEQRRIVLAASLPPGEPLLEETHNHNHNHNHTHDHAHDHPADPHAWLDPQVMLRFIDQAAAQLSEQSPADAPATQERAERAKLTVRRIDQLYRERLTALPTKTIVTHHNAWAYLARRYGLEVAAVIQPMHDVEPTPGDVAAAADAIRARGVHAIFVEPQFSRAAADRIAAATGARVLTLDSLGDGDWPEMMERNLDALIQGLATK